MPKLTDQAFKEKSDLILAHIDSGSTESLQKAIDLIIQIASDNQYFFDSLLSDMEALIEKKRHKKDPEAFTTFLENFIAVLLKQKEKLEYHDCLLGFLYNIKDEDKADSIHYHQLAISKNNKFLPSYFQLGLIYLKQDKPDAALEKMKEADIDIGTAVYYKNGSYLFFQFASPIPELLDLDVAQRQKITAQLDQAISFINESRNVYINLKTESQSTESKKNLEKDLEKLTIYLSNLHSARASLKIWKMDWNATVMDWEAAVKDITTAIMLQPTPENYFHRCRTHAHRKYFFKALQDLYKYIFPDYCTPKLMQATQSRLDHAKTILLGLERMMNVFEKKHRACKASTTLAAFITAYNQFVDPINMELEKLASKDKMERLTLLDDLQTATSANKTTIEMRTIYNSHVKQINELLAYFNMPQIEKLVMLPSLFTLAGLVAIKSGSLERSFEMKTIPLEIITALHADSFIQVMSPQPRPVYKPSPRFFGSKNYWESLIRQHFNYTLPTTFSFSCEKAYQWLSEIRKAELPYKKQIKVLTKLYYSFWAITGNKEQYPEAESLLQSLGFDHQIDFSKNPLDNFKKLESCLAKVSLHTFEAQLALYKKGNLLAGYELISFYALQISDEFPQIISETFQSLDIFELVFNLIDAQFCVVEIQQHAQDIIENKPHSNFAKNFILDRFAIIMLSQRYGQGQIPLQEILRLPEKDLKLLLMIFLPKLIREEETNPIDISELKINWYKKLQTDIRPAITDTYQPLDTSLKTLTHDELRNLLTSDTTAQLSESQQEDSDVEMEYEEPSFSP